MSTNRPEVTTPAAEPAAPLNIKYLIHSAITLLLLFGFGFLPAVAPLTPMGMKLIGVLLGFIYGWTTVGLIWPSILGMVATALSGAMPMKQVILTGFGSDTTMMILFIFVFAAIIEQAGISKFIAMWMITKPVFFGKPWLFSFAFLLTAYVLSALTSTIAAIIICWGLLYGICGQLGFKPKERYPVLMIFGVVYAATLGLSAFPFKSVPLGVLGVYTQLSGISVDFLLYVCFTIPLGLLSIVCYTLLCKFIFRPDVTALKQLNRSTFQEEDLNLQLNQRQKIVISFLFALVLCLLLPSLLPATWTLRTIMTNIGATGTVMMIVAIMVLLHFEGQPLLNFRKMAAEGIQWDVIILTAAIMPFVPSLTAEGTGVTPFLANLLSPIFAGKSAFVFIILVLFLSLVMTNLCNNGVTGILFVTVTYGFAQALAINTTVLACLIVFTVHLAVLTPAASPMAAILHGNTEWVTSKDIYRYGLLSVLITGILLIVIGIPLANLLF